MQSINKYYLVGIKGTGMSSLAKLLKEEGNEVLGSDVDEYYFTEDTLKEQEIEIKSFNRSNITKDYFYIIGNAFNKSNIEVDEIINQKNDYLYYHEFIGQKLNKKIIACSGTHGKTTTSFLLVDFLEKECNYIIGDGEGGSFDTDLLVLEACEYKEHFLSYHPELLIITNIELDHTDFYKNEKQLFTSFQKLANQSQMVLVNGDDKWGKKIKHINKLTYGFNKNNDIQIKILSTTTRGYYIQVKYQNNMYLKVPYLGRHMIYNYVSSYMAAILLKKKPFLSEEGKLPKRRLSTCQFKNSVVIDDYAHHPTEIKSLCETLRLMYPTKKINVIFQPHTYERTLHFKKDFIKVLKKFDKVYILDVFTSKRENKNYSLQKKIDKFFHRFYRYDDECLKCIGKLDDVWVFLGAGVTNRLIQKLTYENI